MDADAMIRKAIIILLVFAGCAWADGPKYGGYEANTALEFQNVYSDLRSPKIGVGSASTFTVTGLTVSTITAVSSATITNLRVTSLTGVSLGKVLQAVAFSESVEHTTTSSTLQSTTIAATITPVATTSKVLILMAVPVNPGATNEAVTVKRGATDLGQSFGFGILTTSANTIYSVMYLDSPSTTSATTYTVYFRNSDNVTTVQCGRSSGVSTITLLEIGA